MDAERFKVDLAEEILTGSEANTEYQNEPPQRRFGQVIFLIDPRGRAYYNAHSPRKAS